MRRRGQPCCDRRESNVSYLPVTFIATCNQARSNNNAHGSERCTERASSAESVQPGDHHGGGSGGLSQRSKAAGSFLSRPNNTVDASMLALCIKPQLFRPGVSENRNFSVSFGKLVLTQNKVVGHGLSPCRL